jgi:hypothetical protein
LLLTRFLDVNRHPHHSKTLWQRVTSSSRFSDQQIYKGPALRMTDMRLGRLLRGADGDHSVSTLNGRVAHMSPSSSGAEVQ